jgi:hypothetical protein
VNGGGGSGVAEGRPAFLKKSSKKPLIIGSHARFEGRAKLVKVFWFFFSKKNIFPVRNNGNCLLGCKPAGAWGRPRPVGCLPSNPLSVRSLPCDLCGYSCGLIISPCQKQNITDRSFIPFLHFRARSMSLPGRQAAHEYPG